MAQRNTYTHTKKDIDRGRHRWETDRQKKQGKKERAYKEYILKISTQSIKWLKNGSYILIGAEI